MVNTSQKQARGPLMCGIESTTLTANDRRRLQHPLVGGVILFARNVVDRTQVRALCDEIQALRSPPLLIAIDQEGGRVQRLRAPAFVEAPAMATLGERFAIAPLEAEAEAEQWGAVIGRELRSCGIDFSFAPVLDLDYGKSAVIGNRAFAAEPTTVARLAAALRRGMQQMGCVAVGKHFPGHGFVEGDSHLILPTDERDVEAIQADLMPYQALINQGLEAVMMAHVIYSGFDDLPAGYSHFWVEEVLRQQLRFDGLVFSDDLGMVGAQSVGDWPARAQAALDAGCDVLLACNDFEAIDDLLEHWHPELDETRQALLARRWQTMVADGSKRFD